MTKRPATPKSAPRLPRTEPNLPSRVFDAAFYRSFYPSSSTLTDEALIAQAAASQLPADHYFNAGEFLHHAKTVLPSGFDWQGYMLANPELDISQEWQAAAHYLTEGKANGAVWTRPFDPDFYRDLYFGGGTIDEAWLRTHWAANPSNHGSLREALTRNGFKSHDWVESFDVNSYLRLNSLTERLTNRTQGLVHFIEVGSRAMLPISEEASFDVDFYREFLENPAEFSDLTLYLNWVERGIPLGAAANEAAQMRELGFFIETYPAGFDWRSYLEEHPDRMLNSRNRWGALTDLADIGILEGGPLPIEPATLPAILEACADRFAGKDLGEQAVRLYDQLVLMPDVEGRVLQHAADLALRQGRHARALGLYRAVHDAEEPTFWTWVNGVTCAIELKAFDEAQDWIERGLALFPRNEYLNRHHLNLQHERFRFAMSRHLARLRAGQTETGIEHELDRIFAAHMAVHRVQFGESTSRPRREGPPRVAFLANQDLPQCTFYRVSQKVEQLLGHDVVLTVVDRNDTAAFLSALATADAALFYRVASDPNVLGCIAACRAANIPTIYEIDDLVFDPGHFPEPLDRYSGTITAAQHLELRAGVALVRHALGMCDFGIASTSELAGHMRGVRTGEVFVHRNGLSRELESLARAGTGPRSPRPTVTIFYGSGTKAHGADFHDLLEPVLIRLMAEQPSIRFVACGYVDAGPLMERFPGRIDAIPLQTDRSAYLGLLSNADIALSVLTSNPFNDCKSEIKWLEAAAFGIPSVVPDTASFREVLTPGETVVLCPPEPAAWYAALRRLVLDPKERARMGQAAREQALAIFGQGALGRGLDAELRRIAGRPDRLPAAARKPRVLIVNVFFPPQAIGGATRVVRDLAAGLLADHGETFELGVLCGNDEEAEPYQLNSYCWRDIPVWSINTPRREHMDWIPEDPKIAPIIDRVLDAFCPDLVHFHSIQRLTVTAVERVHQRGIPYAVTAHDAWWLSDHQFLIDQTNRLKLPGAFELYESEANPHSLSASARRKLMLRKALGEAAAVVAVSGPFAELYRQAGIGATQVLENGLPELPPLEPSPPPEGKVRVGHIGGAVYHKGFFLLKQTLMRGQFDRIQLFVLDHTLTPGESRRERWGASDAFIFGRVPQARIGWLYGQFDVLAAPSLWPESFGLVTREALVYGRWVIASNRGAIGDVVLPGENGWVIDAGDPRALSAVLEQLQASPERFVRPPAIRFCPRSWTDMVRDYATLWTSILARSGSLSHGGDGQAVADDAATVQAGRRAQGRQPIQPRTRPRRRDADDRPVDDRPGEPA